MAGVRKRLGSLLGPTGIKGDKGDLPTTQDLLNARVAVWAPGKNLYNYATDTVNYSLESFSGNLVALNDYRASDYIAVQAGQSYTMTAARQWAFYNTSKVYHSGSNASQGAARTVTAPVDGFMRFAYHTLGGLNPVTQQQMEKSATATPHSPFERQLEGFVMSSGDAGPLSVTRGGNSLAIATKLGTADIVINATLAGGGNSVFNFTSTTVGAASVHATTDDVAPIRTQHGTVGGNHGFALLGVWQAVDHNKTVADLGSVWTDGSREYVLLGIDVGRAFFGGSYTTDAGGVVTMAAVTPTTNLTHVSGATNTAPLDHTKRVATGNYQLWPAVGKVRQAVLLDGATVADGNKRGRELVVRESYEVLDYKSIYDTAKTNIGVPIASRVIGGAVRVESEWTFREGGVATLTTALTEIKPTPLSTCGLVQAVALSGTATRYIPGVKAKGGFDWSAGVPLAGYAVTQLLATTDLHNPAHPPVLTLDVRSDVGFALGYKPFEAGVTSSAARLVEAPSNLWDIRSTKKSYPTAILAEDAGWGRIEGHAFRAYLTPAQSALVAAAGTDATAAWAAVHDATALP